MKSRRPSEIQSQYDWPTRLPASLGCVGYKGALRLAEASSHLAGSATPSTEEEGAKRRAGQHEATEGANGRKDRRECGERGRCIRCISCIFMTPANQRLPRPK